MSSIFGLMLKNIVQESKDQVHNAKNIIIIKVIIIKLIIIIIIIIILFMQKEVLQSHM